eukprot:6178544-Pleurochrysis_carterae.AAC.2
MHCRQRHSKYVSDICENIEDEEKRHLREGLARKIGRASTFHRLVIRVSLAASAPLYLRAKFPHVWSLYIKKTSPVNSPLDFKTHNLDFILAANSKFKETAAGAAAATE